MDFRLPIGPLLNFAGPGPYMNHYLPPREGTQLDKAALILHISFKYWLIIKRFVCFLILKLSHVLHFNQQLFT